MPDKYNSPWGYSVPNHVIEAMMTCENMTALETVASRYVSDIGFKKLTYHLVKVDGYGDPLLAFISDYPREWLERYVEKGYVHQDLVHTQSRRTVVPFAWRSLYSDTMKKTNALVFNEATEFGIADGFSVPIHGPGSFAVFSVVPEGSKNERASSLRLGRDALTTLALHLHEKARSLLETQIQKITDTNPSLTARERECLQWVAAGKVSSEIAMILGITEDTVNIHIRSAMHKLNAQTRAHAAVKAVVLGIIESP